MKQFFLPTVVVALMLTACGPNYLYRHTYKIPATGWTYADSLTFPFVIEDTLGIYDLELDLDHTAEFPFQNLYVRLHTTFPSGQRLTELVSLELADQAGNWLGDCGRTSCQLHIPIQSGAYFNQAGAYQFTLEPFLRRDSLPGITAVTFGVKDTGQRR